VCIWETRSCKQLQRLNHPFNTRAIAACGFSSCGRKLVTVGTDNPHSLFIWNWMTDQNKLRFLSGEIMDPLPGWPVSPAPGRYGPDKKMSDLENAPSGFYFKPAFKVLPPGHMPVSSGVPEKGEPELGGAPEGYSRPEPDNGMSAPPEPRGEEEAEEGPDAWKKGADFALEPSVVFSAQTGAPPQVFGVVWNPFKADEFVTFGVKHIKWWRPNPDTGTWEGISGSFGSKVDNVLSAVFVRDSMAPYRDIMKDKDTGKLFNRGNAKVTRTGKVIHYTRDPNNLDKIIKETYKEDIDLEGVTATIVLTGFPTGEIGVWVDGLLMRCVEAHHKGPQVIMPDGACTFMGVRCLKLRADRKTVLSGGADGCVYAWDVRQTVDDQPQYFKNIGDEIEIDGYDQDMSGRTKQQSQERKNAGTALKGATKGTTSHSSNVLGRGAVKFKRLPGSWKLTSPYKEDMPPVIRSVDAQPGSLSFVVGTNKCDIWEMAPSDADGNAGRPKCLTNGHTADVYACATHPKRPNVFASAAESSNVRLWDSRARELMRATSVGFQCRSVQFSQDGQHLAVGGKLGRLKILKADTMQPLVTFKKCNSAIDEIKYAPNNRLLATGSHDLYIDIYDTGFRGPGGDKGKSGKVLKYPEMNTMWEKEKGGKGEYIHMSRCSGHSATISHLDFSLPLFNPPELRGRTLIVSNCNSYEILYWDALTGQQILANQRDTKWHTRTTMLGFDVMGIWPDGSMNVSVNALDRSHNLEYAATGDDYSLVKIFNYPVVHDDAPWRECKGHSSHVTSVRWSCDDRTLISVGGGDRSAFQFRTTGVNKCDGGHEAFKSRRKETPWCDVAQCIFCGRNPLPPPQPPLWGPLDDQGRTWGAIDYNPRTGKCSCANCEMRMRQEFRVFDPDATGSVTKMEFKLVLNNFGEQQVTMETVNKAMLEYDLAAAEGEGKGDDALVPYESVCARWDAAIKARWVKHEAAMQAARRDTANQREL
jgi:WD40 repeat protein